MSEDAESSPAPSLPPAAARTWRTNLVLFLATVVSVVVTGVFSEGEGLSRAALVRGASFAATLLTILVAHELGHYVAARVHKVDASLPYFLPLPLLSPFGTMGAVIRMRGIIPTRKALLDIGAAGPLAGLFFAIPLYALGASRSTLVRTDGDGMVMLGESVLLKLLDRLFGPSAPDGMEMMLSPIAFGAWGGFFVTMINLLPVGQLDGGHVAYALFGKKQDRFARVVHTSMLVFFLVCVFGHAARDVSAGIGLVRLGRHLSGGLFWLVWFQVLPILGMVAARGQGADAPPGSLSIRARIFATLGLVVLASLARDAKTLGLPLAFFAALGLLVAMEVKGGTLRRHDLLDHPPTSEAPLGVPRSIVAVVTLLFFALLFMPEPFSM